jgi:hypothetical protein
VWVNPPYGREIDKWVSKGKEYAHTFGRGTVVMLLPGRIDTKWFHHYIWDGQSCALGGRQNLRGISIPAVSSSNDELGGSWSIISRIKE